MRFSNLFLMLKEQPDAIKHSVCLVVGLLLVVPAFAQMGYPLKGSWSGG